jgi:hypothetical protein
VRGIKDIRDLYESVSNWGRWGPDDQLGWLHERGIAMLASDGGNDALPWPQVRERLPIHVGCIVFMGVHLIDNLYTERLAEASRELGRWEFLFTLAPLTFQGATGSVVNPTADF